MIHILGRRALRWREVYEAIKKGDLVTLAVQMGSAGHMWDLTPAEHAPGLVRVAAEYVRAGRPEDPAVGLELRTGIGAFVECLEQPHAVLFRYHPDMGVIALFPDTPYDAGGVGTLAFLADNDQFCGANLDQVMFHTKPLPDPCYSDVCRKLLQGHHKMCLRDIQDLGQTRRDLFLKRQRALFK